MVDTAMLQVVRDLVAIFGVIAGFSYYVLAVQNALKARKTQLLLQLKLKQLDLELIQNYLDLMECEWDDFDDFTRKYDSSVNPTHYAKRYQVWSFLDGIGYLLHQGLIDLDASYHLMHGISTMLMWNKWEPVINQSRNRDNNPEEWKWFEYLNDEIIKLRKRKDLSY